MAPPVSALVTLFFYGIWELTNLMFDPFDGVVSTLLVRELVRKGTLPPWGESLARFAGAVDQGRWTFSADKPDRCKSVALAFYAIEKEVLGRFIDDTERMHIGLALVEKGAEGLEIKDIEGADRTRRLFQVSFANTPSEALPAGSAAATQVRDVGLVLLAADAQGLAPSRWMEAAVASMVRDLSLSGSLSVLNI